MLSKDTSMVHMKQDKEIIIVWTFLTINIQITLCD